MAETPRAVTESSQHSFMIKVNGGAAVEFIASTGVYVHAVMQAFGKLDMPYPCDVEIWMPSLLPDYGPYFYRIDDFVDSRGNVYGCPAVMNSRPIAKLRTINTLATQL